MIHASLFLISRPHFYPYICLMNLYDNIKSGTFLIAGPCVIEDEDMVMRLAEKIASIADELKLTYVFKASFDKANRTSLDSYRGGGL